MGTGTLPLKNMQAYYDIDFDRRDRGDDGVLDFEGIYQ